jgi:hypothetical protein
VKDDRCEEGSEEGAEAGSRSDGRRVLARSLRGLLERAEVTMALGLNLEPLDRPRCSGRDLREALGGDRDGLIDESVVGEGKGVEGPRLKGKDCGERGVSLPNAR